MSKNTDTRQFWRAEIGDDASEALWNAFQAVEPPKLEQHRSARSGGSWMWIGMAASWAAIATLAAWNMNLQKDVAEAQEQTALVLLAAERSDRVLAGLSNVRQLDRDPAITAALLELLKHSDDPNLQIEALDLLLDDVLKDPDLQREVLEQVQFNRSFVEFAIQNREVRT